MGNKRRTRTLTIWTDPVQIARLDRLAEANGQSRAEFARMCLNAGFKALAASGLIEK